LKKGGKEGETSCIAQGWKRACRLKKGKEGIYCNPQHAKGKVRKPRRTDGEKKNENCSGTKKKRGRNCRPRGTREGNSWHPQDVILIA